jgi:F-type H+-transporting ATPase subunit delta
MAVRGVAKRYAQAAFDIARESDTVEAWLRDLTRLSQADADGVTGEFFTSPNVPERTKRQAIDQLLPNPDQQYVRNLAYMLIERRRFDILPDLLEVFRDMMLEAQGIAIANVTTAVDLTPEEREQIKAQLKSIVGKDIELRAHTDPSMIGGLVARIGDQLIDGSVASQLNQMRATLAR